MKMRVCSLLALMIFAASAWPFGRDLPLLPFPDDVVLTVVGEELSVYGLPLMAYEFHSAESVADIARFYKDEWEKNRDGADADAPYLEMELAGWKVLSRLELGHNITLQLRDGIRGTQALVGVSPLPRLLLEGRENRVDIHIPVLGGTRVTSVVASRDRGRRSAVYWLISDASVDGFLSLYKRHHEERGGEVRGYRLVRDEGERSVSGMLSVAAAKGGYRYDVMQGRDRKTRVTAIWRPE
jgi:hypothetical protein